MGVDTKGYLSKDIKASEIYKVVCSKFDSNAKFDIRDDGFNKEVGMIHFNYNQEQRNLFFCVTSDRLPNTPLDGIEHVSLILRKWGSSIEIMNKIVSVFGGYVDEDDCDDHDAIYVDKNDKFVYADHIKERESIYKILDDNLEPSLRNDLVTQIMKHRDKLKEVLQKENIW